MKKALLVLLALFILTSCTKEKEPKEKDINVFEIIDEKFNQNEITFSRDAKLNEDDYYAKEGWQYVINDASCIVDVYYFGEDSSIYKDALEKEAIRAKQYDNQYFSATVNKGMAAIIWDGCSNYDSIKNILMNL